MGSRVLKEKLCHLKSTLRFNDIHIFAIRRFCISKGGSVPLPSDMRGSTVIVIACRLVTNDWVLVIC